MSFFEFFSQYNFPLLVYILHYGELLLGLSLAFLMFKVGRIGLSMGITSFAYLCKLLFDQFWMYYVMLMPSGELKLALWYNGFALACLLMLIVVHRYHISRKLAFSPFVVVFILIHFLGIALQSFRYLERVFFETQVLNLIYEYGIPTINIVGLGVLIFGGYQSFRRCKEFPQRIPWEWEK